MDAEHTHERDQQQGQMREFSASLARDVAIYRKTLVQDGIPSRLADKLTEAFAVSWLAAHVEMQAAMGDVALFIGGDDDDV